jgi:hypothetical protein
MTEKTGYVRNPLSVVAIFAGIAEVSGSVVLPFIDKEHQGIYIYFLIWFPTYLVTLFFFVLLFKHKVLYAPSDFKDDKAFMDLIKPASPSEKIRKIDEEIKEEIKKSPQHAGGRAANTPPPTDATSHKESDEVSDIRNRYIAAEEMAIGLVSKDLGISFSRNSEVRVGDSRFTFDAIGVENNYLHAIEVKSIRSPMSVQTIVRRTLEKIAAFSNSIPDTAKERFTLTLVIVLDGPAAMRKEIVSSRLKQLTSQFSFVNSIRVYTFEELKSKIEGA